MGAPSSTGLFSATVMEHFLEPRNSGDLEAPSAEGCAGSVDEGRFVRLQLLVRGQVVQEGRFRTYGCAPAIAACSVLTEWVRGRPIAEAEALTATSLEEMLGGLPPTRRFCAELAVEALRRALDRARIGSSREEVHP